MDKIDNDLEFPLPDLLVDFAYVADMDNAIKVLATLAEEEDWNYHNTEAATPRLILRNYVFHTYRRVAEERKISLSQDQRDCCFNTGLVTAHQEALYAIFDHNPNVGRQRWRLHQWSRRGDPGLNQFPTLPDLAHYFDDPSCLVLDTRREMRVNIEHIIAENRERFPEPYHSMSAHSIQTLLRGAIDIARERVRRNYKTAIPQYYQGKVQLLLPLCLSDPKKADLALVVEKHDTFYRATTCLTLDMAYNNSRQITCPDRDWLQP